MEAKQNLDWMNTELQEMKGGFIIKAQLLKKKLKDFESSMLFQYSSLQQKLLSGIEEFQVKNQSATGFYVDENNSDSINQFEKLKDLFVRWNDDSRKIFSKIHKLQVRKL